MFEVKSKLTGQMSLSALVEHADIFAVSQNLNPILLRGILQCLQYFIVTK